MAFYLSCKQPYEQGKVLYQFHCENCHMEDGSGLAKLIPDLADSDLIQQSRNDIMVCIIRNGIRNPETGQEMPPNKTMTEVEITNLLNYLNSMYLHHSAAIKVEEIEQWLAACKAVEN